MAFAGGLGMTLNLKNVPLGEPIDRDDYILFSESNTRFLTEIAPEDKTAFEKAMNGVTFAQIGKVTRKKTFVINGLKGNSVLEADIDELKEAWQKPLRW